MTLRHSRIDSLGSFGYNGIEDRMFLLRDSGNLCYRELSRTETIYDPYTIFRGDDNMSFVCAYIARDGIVLASDTRRTVTDEHGNVLAQYDDEQKIFQIPNTNILMAITGGCRFGEKREFTCKDAIKNLSRTGFRDLCLEVSDNICAFGVHKELLLAFYQPVLHGTSCFAKQCCIRMWENSDILMSNKTWGPGAVFPQGENVSKSIFDSDSVPNDMFLEEAIAHIGKKMWRVLDFAQYRDELGSIGGRCDMYIARPNGVEHIG